MTLARIRGNTTAKEIAAAERQADARRRAFTELMAAHRLKPADLARLADLPSANAIYNFLNGHSDSFAQATLERIAKALNVSVAEVFGERKVKGRQAGVVPVHVEIASGDWRDAYEVGGRNPPLLPIPPGAPVDEAGLITDSHASAVYKPGTMVGIQSMASLTDRGLRDGDRVLLHRIRNRQHEVTVRQVAESGTRNSRSAELIYATTDRRYGSRLPVPFWPYEGQIWEMEGDRYQIRGRVILGLIMDDE